MQPSNTFILKSTGDFFMDKIGLSENYCEEKQTNVINKKGKNLPSDLASNVTSFKTMSNRFCNKLANSGVLHRSS